VTPQQRKISTIVSKLLGWFSQNARDLPWRRTRDPYAIWVSEIMLQQTQVKTVLPFWERWMRELPTIEAVAKASPDKIHKLWEGLGYYTRVRNLQKAAQRIVAEGRRRGHESQIKTRNKSETPHVVSYEFPEKFEEVLALPGIGRYTAGAICSIAFNQPTPILDGNVVRVLTRIFGIEKDPREKETNELLWRLATDLVSCAGIPRNSSRIEPSNQCSRCRSKGSDGDSPSPGGEGRGEGEFMNSRVHEAPINRFKGRVNHSNQHSAPVYENCCSHLNQSLMELGALVCAPRNPQCLICPVKKLCVAFKGNRTEELPNLGKREAATARRFVAFVMEHRGKFLVRQRPEKVVNAHLWEFPNVELNGHASTPAEVFESQFGFAPPELQPLPPVKHSITRYRITLEAFRVPLNAALKTREGRWLSHSQFDSVAFTAAHKKLANFEVNRMLAGR
jgi:adenine-specific DNA glycosylase